MAQIPQNLHHSLPSNFALPAFSPDLAIGLIIGLTVVTGLLLGHNRLKTFAMSVYVGIVLSEHFAKPIANLLDKNHNTSGRFSANIIQLVVFAAPIILLEFGRHHKARGSNRGGMGMTLVLGTLTAALVVSSALNLFDSSTLNHLTEQSFLAREIFQLRLWWLGLVPIAVIGESLIRPKE